MRPYKAMSVHGFLLLIMVTLLIVLQLNASMLHITETHRCEDITSDACGISFAMSTTTSTTTTPILSSSSDYTFIIPLPNWLQNVNHVYSSLATTTTGGMGNNNMVNNNNGNNPIPHDKLSCHIDIPTQTLYIEFLAGHTNATVCWFGKSDETLQPSVTITNAQIVNATWSSIIEPITFPAMSYYKQSFEWLNPSASCSNPNSVTSCSVTLVIPSRLSQWFIDTPDEVTVTSCVDNPTTPVITYAATPQRIEKDVQELENKNHVIPTPKGTQKFTVNRYNFLINTNNLVDSTQRLQCNLVISKTSGLAPYFKILTTPTSNSNGNNNNNQQNNQQNNIVIYQTTTAQLVSNKITLSLQTDCTDNTNPLCTIEYRNVPIQHNFKVFIPFFSFAYDTMPVLHQVHQDPADNTSPVISFYYTQRFVKIITTSATNSGTATAPVYIYSNGIGQFSFTLPTANITYAYPISVSYDEERCQNGWSPICPLIIRSRYIGYPSIIRLNAIPLTGIVENVICGEGGVPIVAGGNTIGNIINPNMMNMRVYSNNPTQIHFTAGQDAPSLSTAPIVGNTGGGGIVNATNTEHGYYQCQLNIALPFDGNEYHNDLFNAQHGIFKIHQIVFYQPTQRFVTVPQATPLSLPLLAQGIAKFNKLPFVIQPHESCQYQHIPYCGYRLIIDPHALELEFGLTETSALEERQKILNLIYIRKLTIPLYNLRQPIYKYGQTINDMVNVKVINSNLLQVKIESVDWSFEEKGYDSITLVFSTYLNSLLYDAYFINNKTAVPTDGIIKKSQLYIDIEYEMISPLVDSIGHHVDIGSNTLDNIIQTAANKEYNIKLLSYNGVKNIEQPPSLYLTKPNEFFWLPKFMFHIDKTTCELTNAAFCLLKFFTYPTAKYNTLITGPSIDILNSTEVHSILLEFNTAGIIDQWPQLTSNDLIANIISPRQTINQNGVLQLSDYLYINITFPSIAEALLANGDINNIPNVISKDGLLEWDFAFTKRIGADNGVINFKVMNYTTIQAIDNNVVENEEEQQQSFVVMEKEKEKQEEKQETTAITTTSSSLSLSSSSPYDLLWDNETVDHLYILSRVRYHGDMKFQFNDDCEDPSSILCSAKLTIHTNNIYPNQTLIEFDVTYIFTAFFWSDQLQCEGWEGISMTESSNYIRLGISLARMMLWVRAVIPADGDPKFSASNPLHYNPKTTSHITCYVTNYKFSYRKLFTPAVYPNVMLGVPFSTAPYSLYPSPQTMQGIFVKYGTLRYSQFYSTALQDCRTTYSSNIARCTHRWVSNASLKNPIVGDIRGKLSVGEFQKQITLRFTLFMVDLIYAQLFCSPNAPKPSDLPSDPGAAYGFHIDDDLIVTIDTAVLTQQQNNTFNGNQQIDKVDWNNYHKYYAQYRLRIPLCNRDPVNTNIELRLTLLDYYRTRPGMGYHTQTLDLTLFDVVGFKDVIVDDNNQEQTVSILLRNVIQDPLPYQLLVNVPEVIDPTAVYAYNQPNPALVMQSPDRQFFGEMVFGKLFSQKLNQTKVYYSTDLAQQHHEQHVDVTYTLHHADIQSITVDTLLGNFNNNNTWQYCYYTFPAAASQQDINQGGADTPVMIQQDESLPLGRMYTDLSSQQTILTFDTTVVQRIVQLHQADPQRARQQLEIECTVQVPVNRIYPYKSDNVLHTVKLWPKPPSTETREFYSYWSYATWSNAATIHGTHQIARNTKNTAVDNGKSTNVVMGMILFIVGVFVVLF